MWKKCQIWPKKKKCERSSYSSRTAPSWCDKCSLVFVCDKFVREKTSVAAVEELLFLGCQKLSVSVVDDVNNIKMSAWLVVPATKMETKGCQWQIYLVTVMWQKLHKWELWQKWQIWPSKNSCDRSKEFDKSDKRCTWCCSCNKCDICGKQKWQKR